MNIIHSNDVPFVSKPEGTLVHYFLRPGYEIHHNEQAPHTTQTWHHHDQITETLFILSGSLVARWRDEKGDEHEQTLQPLDLVETGRTPHTFENASDDVARFVVFKQVLDGKDHSETFKTDKILD